MCLRESSSTVILLRSGLCCYAEYNSNLNACEFTMYESVCACDRECEKFWRALPVSSTHTHTRTHSCRLSHQQRAAAVFTGFVGAGGLSPCVIDGSGSGGSPQTHTHTRTLIEQRRRAIDISISCSTTNTALLNPHTCTHTHTIVDTDEIEIFLF